MLPHPLSSFGSHLYLVLLPRILDGLEDVPGAAAPHLQPGHILPVPALDQQSGPHGCGDSRETEPLSGWLGQGKLGSACGVMPQIPVVL